MLLPTLLLCVAAQAANPLAREIYAELIGIDTTHSTGNTTVAAEAMAARLRSAGFSPDDMRVLGPHPRKGNLVARMRGTGSGRPILLLAHLDVVEAKREDWSADPFRLLEKDGYFYGRGTGDDKGQAAMWIANFIRYKQEGWRPARDLIVALTADEESGGEHNGVEWLLKNHRGLIDAAFCLNEGGMGQLKNGKPLVNQVQVSEKATLNLQLEVRNKGGHSSMPRRDNAIYQLSRAIARLEEYEFPVQLDAVNREYFARMAKVESGETARDMASVATDPQAARRLSESPYYNALLRNTCTATRLDGGHADNALPQLARVVVNCRLLPGEDPAAIEAALRKVIRDPEIAIVRRNHPKLSQGSAVDQKLFAAIERVTAGMWPGTPVVPVMTTGGTDGRDLRNGGIPAYGVSGIFYDMEDVRWHGRDERVAVKSFDEALEFLYRLVRNLAE
jgi:acetylornithine deacetylase/succinyl-diaminopimelate desuccinylase-like protein